VTSIKVRGVNRVRSKGRIYHYHRATGARIQADPKEAVAFAAEVAVLNAERHRINLEARPGTLGALITLYRRASAFVELAPDTQKGYQRAFDACKALDSMPLVNVNQALILGLQERIYRKKGRWLANMAVSVLSVVLGWGVPRGLTHSNAAGGVPKIRRPRSAPIANRAWTEREVQAALEAARGGLRKAIALAYYGGLRKKDVGELRASSCLNGMIDTTQSKTGNELSVYEAKKLTAILDEPDKRPGEYIVVSQLGKPYTRDGLDSVFDHLKRDLVAAKAIRPGLTFHGLRKSLGKRAADAGFSELDIAAALGHSNPASSRPYTVEAARKSGARRVIQALDKKRT
jgi:integrase